MASIPAKIQKFTALEMDFGTSVAQALWTKAAQLTEYVNRSYPIGMLLFYNASQSALNTLPDPKYWKYLDGTPVTNPLSPVNGATLPDMRGLFIKHPATGAPALVVAGANSVSLDHSHTGNTDYGSDWDSLHLHQAVIRTRGQAIGSHRHTMSGSIGSLGSVSTVPAYIELQVYMRVV
jgi:hypothetical protein